MLICDPIHMILIESCQRNGRIYAVVSWCWDRHPLKSHSQEEVAEMREERGVRIRKVLIKMPGSPDVGQRRRLAKHRETGDASSIYFTCHRSHRTAAIKNSWKVCRDSLISCWESESVQIEGGGKPAAEAKFIIRLPDTWGTAY